MEKSMSVHPNAQKEAASWQYFDLNGLGCANCGAKIATEVGRAAGVEQAFLDFANRRLTVDSQKNQNELREIIQSIADRIEEGITVTLSERRGASQATWREGLREHKRDLVQIILAAVFFAGGHAASHDSLPALALFGLAYLIVGGEILVSAVKSTIGGDVFNESMLMSIASLGAFAIGAWEEAAAVMLFFRLGELAQDLAVERSRRSISQVMNIRPEFARVVSSDGRTAEVHPEEVRVDALIDIRPGERVPLDAQIVSGSAELDTSALTGESLPRFVQEGDDILSGSINLDGMLQAKVQKNYADSTVSKIMDLVEMAAAKKSKMERFITRFARVYTPAVVLAALVLAVLPPLLLPDATFRTWIYRALLFLVCSCPCALVISVPLSYFGGIGAASGAAIMVKGSQYLEALAHVRTVVFDKTGTLTKGRFVITEVVPAPGVDSAELLDVVQSAERASNHPIARAICQKGLGTQKITRMRELPGKGVQGRFREGDLLVGNRTLMTEADVSLPEVSTTGSVVYAAWNGAYIGHIVVADELRPEAGEALQSLHAFGVDRLVMLTGDRASSAQAVGRELGIDDVYAELLPQDKVHLFEKILADQKDGQVAFVGDGINDAPVLARADVGIAMGGIGSDAAIQSADVVLMRDEPQKLAQAIAISRRTQTIVWQNVIFALSVKALVLCLGAAGLATMWAAVFADVGVALLAVLNAMRALQVKGLNRASN